MLTVASRRGAHSLARSELMASETKYLSRKDAAALCGVHYDTIRRAEKAGNLPNTRRVGQGEGAVEIPVSDLVAAGLLDPLSAEGSVEVIAQRTRTERELIELRQELAIERLRSEQREAQLDQAYSEIAFLRTLCTARVA